MHSCLLFTGVSTNPKVFTAGSKGTSTIRTSKIKKITLFSLVFSRQRFNPTCPFMVERKQIPLLLKVHKVKNNWTMMSTILPMRKFLFSLSIMLIFP